MHGTEPESPDRDAILIGPPTMQVHVHRDGGIIHFTLTGEVVSDDVVSAMLSAHDRGWLDPDSLMLFDLTLYAGTIEWQSLRRILDLPCWGPESRRRMRAAYIVRDELWEAVIRVLSTQFEGTRHAAFTSAADARRWLLSFPAGE